MTQHSTLSDRALELLRSSLLRGTFEPGVNLRESDVCELCGVSRTPARLALVALHREGLLDYEPQRGYWVRSFDIGTVLDAYAIRGAVEGLACRLIIEHGFDSELIAELETQIKEGRRLIGAGRSGHFDGDGWRRMNEAFHHAIGRRSGKLFVDVSALVQRIPLAATSVTADLRAEPDLFLIELAQVDHEKICRAFQARQAARAESLMREHLVNAGEVLARSLERNQQDGLYTGGISRSKDSRRPRVKRGRKERTTSAE
jgi:GntR family transcriptional regulator of vanillate catabolism